MQSLLILDPVAAYNPLGYPLNLDTWVDKIRRKINGIII